MGILIGIFFTFMVLAGAFLILKAFRDAKSYFQIRMQFSNLVMVSMVEYFTGCFLIMSHRIQNRTTAMEGHFYDVMIKSFRAESDVIPPPLHELPVTEPELNADEINKGSQEVLDALMKAFHSGVWVAVWGFGFVIAVLVANAVA